MLNVQGYLGLRFEFLEYLWLMSVGVLMVIEM
jgi:hypothetical protein